MASRSECDLGMNPKTWRYQNPPITVLGSRVQGLRFLETNGLSASLSGP